jgi:hypothetical protein
MHKAKGFHNLGALGAFSTARPTCSPTTPCTVLTDPTHYQTNYGGSFHTNIFSWYRYRYSHKHNGRSHLSSSCIELIFLGDWVTRILFLCIHTHVNKRAVKHTEHKYHFQLPGACKHRRDTIHSRAIHLYSSYLYKKHSDHSGRCYTYPDFPFIRECDKNTLWEWWVSKN